MTFRLRPARGSDVPGMAAVEVNAAQRFREVGLFEIADAEPAEPAFVRKIIEEGVAIVAVDADDRPVGFILAGTLDGAMHIHELSVHLDVQRRGIGAALIEAVRERAAASSLPALTLSTFRDVEWNAPYYERLGFRVVDRTMWTPGFEWLHAREGGHGLPLERRVFMRRELS